MEVLFMTSDQPASHEQYQMRQGDPVTVQADGWAWSPTEKRVFLIVRFPDDALTNEGWASLLEPQTVERDVADGNDTILMEVQLRERRYTLDLDKVTPARKAEIVRTDAEKPVSVGEWTIRDMMDKEAAAPRFRNGDKLLSGRI